MDSPQYIMDNFQIFSGPNCSKWTPGFLTKTILFKLWTWSTIVYRERGEKSARATGNYPAREKHLLQEAENWELKKMFTPIASRRNNFKFYEIIFCIYRSAKKDIFNKIQNICFNVAVRIQKILYINNLTQIII